MDYREAMERAAPGDRSAGVVGAERRGRGGQQEHGQAQQHQRHGRMHTPSADGRLGLGAARAAHVQAHRVALGAQARVAGEGESGDPGALLVTFDVVVPHELTHLVFDTAVRNPYHFPPRWLNEGVATYLTEGFTTSDRALVEANATGGRLMPLRALGGFLQSEEADGKTIFPPRGQRQDRPPEPDLGAHARGLARGRGPRQPACAAGLSAATRPGRPPISPRDCRSRRG